MLFPGDFGIDVRRAGPLGAGPAADRVERRRLDPLALGGLPHRFASSPPLRIAGIDSRRSKAAKLRIDKDVRHDAMMLRPATCIRGRVIDQRYRGKGRHEMARPSAL